MGLARGGTDSLQPAAIFGSQDSTMLISYGSFTRCFLLAYGFELRWSKGGLQFSRSPALCAKYASASRHVRILPLSTLRSSAAVTNAWLNQCSPKSVRRLLLCHFKTLFCTFHVNHFETARIFFLVRAGRRTCGARVVSIFTLDSFTQILINAADRAHTRPGL
jgi:hypothetical protein